MQIDANLMSPPVEDAGELAAEAERIGFDCAWVTEQTHSPFTLMSQMGAATDELTVGSAIAVAFPRSPMVTAYTAWDVQRLAGGGLILGLGTQVKGHIERRFSANWESPGPRLRDYVLALREIWDAWSTGREVDHQGEFYTMTHCPPDWTPEPPATPEIPIYIGGVNEYNVRLAGELCDGLHIHPLNSPTYIDEHIVPNIRAGADRAGRHPDDVTLAATTFAVVGETEAQQDEAREEVRRQIAFYASTRTYRKMLDVHGWGDICDELHERSMDGEWDQMAELVTDEMVSAFSVEGSWSDLRDEVESRFEHVDRTSLYIPFRGDSEWGQLVG